MEQRIKDLENRVSQLETNLLQSEARVLEHFKAFSYVVKKNMMEMKQQDKPENVTLPEEEEEDF